MSDEESTATPTAPETEATKPDASAANGTVTPPDDDALLEELLARVSPDKLRKHTRIAGIVGSELQQRQARWQQEQEAALSRKAAEEKEAELLREAQENPVGFADRFLTEAQQKKLQKDLEELRGKTRAEYAERIGKALQQMPEFQEIPPDELAAAFTRALAGKSDEEAVETFFLTAADLTASKRAAKRMQAEMATLLAKERETARKEWEAERLSKEDAPDLARGRRPAKHTGEPDYNKDPVAWDVWYRKTMLR